KAAVLLPVLVLAAREGLAAVAWALVAVTAFTSLLNLAVASHLLGTRWAAIAAALWPSLGAAAAMAAALAGWRALGVELAAPPSLAVQVALGVTVYLGVLRWIDPGALRRALASLRHGRPAAELAEAAGR
ncbi:MAG TPA: hypothetical protein VF100_00255, partial [Thermoanaerobaculia bacterium]